MELMFAESSVFLDFLFNIPKNQIKGVSQLKNFDPFLMLDFFNVKLPAGFPDHPHRGFATLTYLLSGGICHEDFKGHKGELGPGDVQVMTAGS